MGLDLGPLDDGLRRLRRLIAQWEIISRHLCDAEALFVEHSSCMKRRLQRQCPNGTSLAGTITLNERTGSSSWTLVRPAKAGMFSGRKSRRGKSQSPVAWVACVEETKRMKPTDKAIHGMVSESPGRNVSEPTGGLDKK